MKSLRKLKYKDKDYKPYKKFNNRKEAEEYRDELISNNTNNSRRFKPIVSKCGNISLKKYEVCVPVGWK
jgi:hypothetical protein